MKITNKLTGKEIDLSMARITEDNCWVDTASYLEASNILKQGLLTWQEIIDSLSLKTELYFQVSKLLLASRQRAKDRKINIYKYLKDLMTVEQAYCEVMLKKDLRCITIEEHIFVIKWLREWSDISLATYGDEKDGSPNTHDELYNYYLNCRGYITSIT